MIKRNAKREGLKSFNRRKRHLTEGTINFSTFDKVPCIGFDVYEDAFNNFMYYFNETTDKEHLDDEAYQDEKWEEFIEEYNFPIITEEDFDSLKDDIDKFNSDMKDKYYYDVDEDYNYAYPKLSIEPGYYDGYQIQMDESEKYLSDESIEDINKFLKEVKEKYGLGEFSSGWTQHWIKESVNESESGRKLFTEYKVYVGNNLYEISHTEARKNEIVGILAKMYPNEEVKAEPWKHYASGFEREKLQRIIDKQNAEYGIKESMKIKESDENPLKGIRSNVFFDTEDGPVYVDFKDGKLIAGGATNTGIIAEYETEYDFDDSVDGNLQRFYDEIVESNPDIVIMESFKTVSKKRSIKESRASRALALRVRRGEMKHDDELEFIGEHPVLTDKEDNIEIQVQDNESRTHYFNREGRTGSPKVSSHSWGRVWKDGQLVKSFEGPKNKVRQDMAQYLDSDENELTEALGKYTLDDVDAYYDMFTKWCKENDKFVNLLSLDNESFNPLFDEFEKTKEYKEYIKNAKKVNENYLTEEEDSVNSYFAQFEEWCKKNDKNPADENSFVEFNELDSTPDVDEKDIPKEDIVVK